MKLILKPHPACRKNCGEVIDIYSNKNGLPWPSVRVDTFYNDDDTELYYKLYYERKTIVVDLVIIEE